MPENKILGTILTIVLIPVVVLMMLNIQGQIYNVTPSETFNISNESWTPVNNTWVQLAHTRLVPETDAVFWANQTDHTYGGGGWNNTSRGNGVLDNYTIDYFSGQIYCHEFYLTEAVQANITYDYEDLIGSADQVIADTSGVVGMISLLAIVLGGMLAIGIFMRFTRGKGGF